MSPIRITASQLRQQRFARTLRGYDPDEVEQLLSVTADDLESLEADCGRLASRVAALEERVEEFEEMERGLRDAMLLASEAGENAHKRASALLLEAESQRQALLQDGEQRCREMLIDAENRRRELILETDRLESRRSYWLSRLQSLIDDQRGVLEAHTAAGEPRDATRGRVVQMPPRGGSVSTDESGH